MNEHTKKLFDRALDQAVPETWTTLSYEQMTKLSKVFAELIVRECANIGERYADGNYEVYNQILEHFGVEE